MPFEASSINFLALKIARGVYQPLSKQYSQPLRNLVAKMLKTDPQARPTIHEILREPIIRNRIKGFLSASIRLQEFSHTIIHNFSFLTELSARSNESSQSVIEEQKNIKQQMLNSVRQLKIDIKNRGDYDKEQQEEGIMLCEMKEVVLISEGDQEIVSVHGSMIDVPPDREDEIEDNQEEQKIECASDTDEEEDHKIKLIRNYLEGILGKDIVIEAKKILENVVKEDDDLEFDNLFPHLKHIMNRENQAEYVPIIYSMIELERGE